MGIFLSMKDIEKILEMLEKLFVGRVANYDLKAVILYEDFLKLKKKLLDEYGKK